MKQRIKQPMTAWDYGFMIGGPAAFLLVAVLGLNWLLGPAPPPNPIELIRNKTVKPGMTKDEVIAKIGTPRSRVIQNDGSETWTFHHGTADPFVEDDADLAFSAGGTLLTVTMTKSAAPIQPLPADKTAK